MLTFLEERRRRLAKARQEGYEEGFKEGFKEGYEEIVQALSQNPRAAAILREDPRILETLRESGGDSQDRKNGGG